MWERWSERESDSVRESLRECEIERVRGCGSKCGENQVDRNMQCDIVWCRESWDGPRKCCCMQRKMSSIKNTS